MKTRMAPLKYISNYFTMVTQANRLIDIIDIYAVNGGRVIE